MQTQHYLVLIILPMSKIVRLICRLTSQASFFLSVSVALQEGNKTYVCFTEEEGDEIKIGTSCKNGGCTKVCLCTYCLTV